MPATAQEVVPAEITVEPVTETVAEHQGEDPHVITISATIDRVIRGFKTGEDPEHVAGILADMFPDYLEEILKYPEEACVAYIMQYSASAGAGGGRR